MVLAAGVTISPVFTSSTLDHRARRIVAWVAGLNLLGFFIELVVASVIGSAALFADAAGFLEDFLINLLVLTALGWSLASRRKASFGLAGLILIPAIAAFGTAIWKMISGEPPEPLTLSVTAIIAMVINLVCAILLMNLRKADSALMRGAWLAARNDVLANLLILAAGVVTVFWFSAWPDIVVGLVIGVINLTAAKEVYEQARAEDPELEMDDDD
ncbi:cobalt transporter [Corynebacterium sp. HMSC063G05]|uniref:cation transporter n=1 Tax=Corynebacterium sp. HMSC063G05 TaxID=1739255 RepID=UPI0008A3F821|nr:cation transporter [Corynebacterium sp. HMSC063G05]OFL70458.1 cobalt transporter [Corynebacterium sp. HMSC063G05]